MDSAFTHTFNDIYFDLRDNTDGLTIEPNNSRKQNLQLHTVPDDEELPFVNQQMILTTRSQPAYISQKSNNAAQS